jgi:single-strand DNA-binding protein|nr:MAG TPA: Single strand binding protein [Caudoviricetes sp.]
MSSTVTVLGNIGADAERRETQNGTPYLTFTVADSRSKWDAAAGKYVPLNTTWRRVTTFKGLDYLPDQLVRGATVYVSGSEELRTWDKEDGTKGYSLDVTAHVVKVVSKSTDSGAPAQVQTSPVAAYPANTAAPVQQQGYAQQAQPMQGGYAQPAAAAPPAGYQAAANASSGWGGYDNGATPF